MLLVSFLPPACEPISLMTLLRTRQLFLYCNKQNYSLDDASTQSEANWRATSNLQSESLCIQWETNLLPPLKWEDKFNKIQKKARCVKEWMYLQLFSDLDSRKLGPHIFKQFAFHEEDEQNKQEIFRVSDEFLIIKI